MNILYAVLTLGALGALFGLALALASKVFHVEVDEREGRIIAALPGANCGGCGFPGCSGCAAAIVEGKAAVSACVPGGGEVASKVAEIMGVEVGSLERHVAFVRCAGTNVAHRFNYSGIEDCVAALRIGGTTGPNVCAEGCMGFGTCVKACAFGAMSVVDGVAKVDREKCTGCMACAAACPKGLIVSVPYDAKTVVACSNRQMGKLTRAACGSGCIGCGICAKNCPAEAITVTDFLASIDFEKCTGCGICAEKCPRHIIKLTDRDGE